MVGKYLFAFLPNKLYMYSNRKHTDFLPCIIHLNLNAGSVVFIAFSHWTNWV